MTHDEAIAFLDSDPWGLRGFARTLDDDSEEALTHAIQTLERVKRLEELLELDPRVKFGVPKKRSDSTLPPHRRGVVKGDNMTPEWEELKEYATRMCWSSILDKMAEIERRYLPERVAEILEKANGQQNMYRFPCAFDEIAKALRTGDTSEIEQWVKK